MWGLRRHQGLARGRGRGTAILSNVSFGLSLFTVSRFARPPCHANLLRLVLRIGIVFALRLAVLDLPVLIASPSSRRKSPK